MSKSSSRLGRLGVLAPAALSACVDASVMAAPAAGAILSTVLKELSKAFMLKNWFHGAMSAQEAEQLLLAKGKHGSYLVRESSRPGDYVLSVRARARVAHVIIRREHNKYHVGSGESFDELSGLIEHCRAFPLMEASGEVLRLRQPVSAARSRPRHLADKPSKKVPATSPALGPKEPSEAMERQLVDILEGLKALDEERNSQPSDCSEQNTIPAELDKMGNVDRYWLEFTNIKKTDNCNNFTCTTGHEDKNKYKNRYKDIVPFDQTRVVLPRGRCSEGGSDYINASYIRPQGMFDDIVQRQRLGGDEPLTTTHRPGLKEKFYIAAQGSLCSTRRAFWEMIADNDVRVIAMVTNCIENGKSKCDMYWPAAGETEAFDGLRVRTVREDVRPSYVMRELELMSSERRRTVYQYQFTMWPDHRVPSGSRGVLTFLRDVNERLDLVAIGTDAPKQNILCVHCSAGIGRTGTLIALDMLIDVARIHKLSKSSLEAEVPRVVKLLRSQRPGMVQNCGQYRFIYDALADHLNALDNGIATFSL